MASLVATWCCLLTDIKADVTVDRQTVVHRPDPVRNFLFSVLNTTRYNSDIGIYLFNYFKTRNCSGLIVKLIVTSALQTQLQFMCQSPKFPSRHLRQ